MPRKNKSTHHQRFSGSIFQCTKKKYKNEKEAQDAADFQMLENMSLELSVYKCDVCKYWHLTRNVDKSNK